MLYEICKEVQAELTSQGYPLKVIFGEEGFDRVQATESVALVKYAEDGDEWSSTLSPGQAIKGALRKDMGADIVVHGHDNRTGAREQDHKRLVNHNVEAFIVALFKVVQRRKNGMSAPRKAKFMARPDQSVRETGARYQMTVAIGLGVDQTKMPTVPADTLGATSTTTTITTPGLETSTETCATAA